MIGCGLYIFFIFEANFRAWFRANSMFWQLTQTQWQNSLHTCAQPTTVVQGLTLWSFQAGDHRTFFVLSNP